MNSLRSIAILLIATLTTLRPCDVVAQYYTWGSDVPSLSWSEIKQPDVKVIYPDTTDAIARRTLHYINSVKGDISFGYTYPALNIPFVLHPENFQSNGLVMWMPKRIDFLTTPNIDGFSMPWIKQLVAHEYRHAVQYNNLNKGVVKALSYLLGEQGSSLGLLLLPVAILEGDAVKCETSMSTFGRGLQPSFSMGYRAIGREMLDHRNVDRWYCGSYREYTPNHYQLGYQIVDYSYTRFGENIWNKVADFGVRRPYYIVTTSTALKKYYGTDTAHLVRATFNDLFDYWESLPERDNSAKIISTIDESNYTTYSDPIPLDEERVIALKESFSDTNRFVVVDDESGEEELSKHIGSLSTRPTMGYGSLWWSEYRQSKMFMQRVNSRLCYMELDKERLHTIKGYRNILYPTTIGESDTPHLAYVEYTPNGQYSVVEIRAKSDKPRHKNDFEEISRTKIEFPTEVHGLAWDDVTRELYFIATEDSGMWLGRVDSDSECGFEQVTKGAYITISNLRAKGGQLLYGSIESGYDELHCYDLASKREYRVSESKYGSFDPSTPIDGKIYATTYDKYGYHLSQQEIDTVQMCSVEPKNTPQNIVNPPRTKWDLINLDTVSYTPADSVASHNEHKGCKYNKGLKLINVHSWMPVAYNPFDLSAEQLLDVTFGATLISQNLLSSTEAYASYGYNLNEGSLLKGAITYKGLGVELEASGSYGGNQIIYTPYGNYSTTESKYKSISTGVKLPLLFDCGYHYRYLTVGTYWNYTNGLVFDNTDLDNVYLDEGVHKMSFSVGFSDVVRSSTRNLSTPLGYSISLGYAMTPTDNNFKDLLSIYGKITTRGFCSTNSFSLAANYQTSINGDNTMSTFSSVALLPRGFSSTDIVNRNYLSGSINYQFPIWYPEGGIGSIIYFKRVRLNLGFDAARFSEYGKGIETIYSYGGDLILDINPLRMPESGTTAIKASVYKPSIGSVSFTMGVELPF